MQLMYIQLHNVKYNKSEKLMSKKIKIYTDFDGTIAINDVGDKLFAKF